MGARGKEDDRRLSLSWQVRIDREVYEELLRRVAELQTRSGRRRASFNDVLREILLVRNETMARHQAASSV